MSSEDLKTQSARVENWVSKNKDGQLQSSKDAALLAEKAGAEYAKQKQRDDLYREVFDSFTDKESYDIGKGKEFNIESTDAGSGILKALEKRSSVLRANFQAFPDARLIAYQHLFFKFKEQGADVNVLPMNSTVSLKEGLLTVKYPNGKVVTSLLFPWEEAKIPNIYDPYSDKTPVIKPEPAPTRSLVGDKPAPVIEIEKEVQSKETVVTTFEQDWTRIEAYLKTLEEKYPHLTITDESSDYNNFDRPANSKKVQVYNTITGDTFILEIYPKKFAVNYSDMSKLWVKTTELHGPDMSRRDEKKFAFSDKPASVEGAMDGVAKYTSEIRDDRFTLDTHILLSTTGFAGKINQMQPAQKLEYIHSLLVDTKNKYERISGQLMQGKKEKTYLDGIEAEVDMLKAAFATLNNVDESNEKTIQIREILRYFRGEFETNE